MENSVRVDIYEWLNNSFSTWRYDQAAIEAYWVEYFATCEMSKPLIGMEIYE